MELFKDDLENLYISYDECIAEIFVQNRILSECICEDGLLPEAEYPLMAIDKAENELAQIKKDYYDFIEIMGEYRSTDELGEKLFELDKEIMDARYGVNEKKDDSFAEKMSLISDNLTNRLNRANDIIGRYSIFDQLSNFVIKI
jgi:hypothetical protein